MQVCSTRTDGRTYNIHPAENEVDPSRAVGF